MIEREFYGLSDLTNRWACTVDDLLHLGIQDRAQVCVNIYGMAIRTERTRMDTGIPEPSPDDEPLTPEERNEAEAHNAAFEKWMSRTTKDMPHGVFELNCEDLRLLDMPGAGGLELYSALKFDGGWWATEFDPPVSIRRGHLCMLHAEVQRLDREVFGTAPKAIQPAEVDRPLSTTERNTLLKLVIGMAVKCYVYDPKASKSTTPKEIADDLAGLGITITDDTVRKYLKEAAQAFLPESAKPSKPKSV